MTVPSFTILSDGRPMDSTFDVVSLDVERQVNRISSAGLTLLDGDAAQRKFAISDLAFFEPGKSIEIKLRYEGVTKDATVFRGVVVRHAVESDRHGSSLRLVLKDAAIRMTQGRRSADFANKTEDRIFRSIIESHGLKVGKIASDLPLQPVMVQYQVTDWDFLLSRAEALGLVVVAEDGVLSLSKPEPQGSAKHVFEWGLSEIFELEMEAAADHQSRELSTVAWDARKLALTKPNKAKEPRRQQGNLDGRTIAGALKFQPETLGHPVDVVPQELQAWADGRLARSRLALLRGRLSVPGFANIKLLDALKVDGVGKRFNGQTLVTGLRHRVDDTGWRTDVQFGLSAETFSCGRSDLLDPPAAGLVPAVDGLQIGIVDKFVEDPGKQFRVKVKLPLLGEKSTGVWARLAQPDAGPERGFCFRPEAGDEVVVGFFNGDPRQAVILGGMHGEQNKPPKPCAAPDEKNLHKAIVTRKGTTIGFLDQDKPSVFIETAGKNRIVLDDDAQAIQLTDQHGNQVTMNKDGIVIKSAKDLRIEAAGNVKIQGKKIDLQ